MFVFVLVGIVFLLKNKKTDKYKGDCVNYQEKQFFKKPIPIEWTAKFGGCLVSCWGAYFTRIPEDVQYPMFSGYVPDNGDPIPEIYRNRKQTLKIYGRWTDVSDSYGSIFDRKCVPTVEIEKIEILN